MKKIAAQAAPVQTAHQVPLIVLAVLLMEALMTLMMGVVRRIQKIHLNLHRTE